MTTTYKAALKVKAKGYWFSAGGEKGSFGYYPHLKDSEGLPLYPDTQVKGDLRMAAKWLASLNESQSKYQDFLEIFGQGGDPEHKKDVTPARLFAGDLKLTPESARKWKEDSYRFEVKSRIQINEETRTVEQHFLVDLELARLDGLELEAPVYLVIPKDKKKEEDYTGILDEITELLSGFGAFRSRGYGRGTIKITGWKEVDMAPKIAVTGKRFRLALTALSNVRNKPVDPGNSQILPTSYALAPVQVKAWLASAFNDCYGSWPGPSVMKKLDLLPLFPSPAKEILAWPAPMTTLKDEKGKIKDQWKEEIDEKKLNENFFSGKAKPLGPSFTVTEKCRAWPVRTEKRFRNSTDSSFLTLKEGGLFVQELLPAGTVFTGTLSIRDGIDEEVKKLLVLLQEKTLYIKGAIFRAELKELCSFPGHKNNKPGLVMEEIPFDPGHKRTENSVLLGTSRRYNITLKRPRRARIVVQPGSILPADRVGTYAWQGFGEPLEEYKTGPADITGKENKPPMTRHEIELTDGQKAITRAQAGVLRNFFLHPDITQETIISKELKHRIEKYEGKPNFCEQRQLFISLLGILEDKGLEKMRAALEDVLRQLALAGWEKRNRGAE